MTAAPRSASAAATTPTKLERLDQILAGCPASAPTGRVLQTVHLDGPNRDRGPIRLAAATAR